MDWTVIIIWAALDYIYISVFTAQFWLCISPWCATKLNSHACADTKTSWALCTQENQHNLFSSQYAQYSKCTTCSLKFCLNKRLILNLPRSVHPHRCCSHPPLFLLVIQMPTLTDNKMCIYTEKKATKINKNKFQSDCFGSGCIPRNQIWVGSWTTWKCP